MFGNSGTAPAPIRLAQNGPAAFGSLAPPASPVPRPMAAPPTPQAPSGYGTGISPIALALARLSATAQLGGLPDIAKGYETAYYGSPGYKGQVAGAEGWAKAGPELYVKNNEPYTLRPGAIRGGPNGPIASAPVQVDAVDPATVIPLIFADVAASQASMTRTMAINDQSVSDTPAAIAGVTR